MHLERMQTVHPPLPPPPPHTAAQKQQMQVKICGILKPLIPSPLLCMSTEWYA